MFKKRNNSYDIVNINMIRKKQNLNKKNILITSMNNKQIFIKKNKKNEKNEKKRKFSFTIEQAKSIFYVKNLLENCNIENKSLILKNTNFKHHIFFDLDETLVYKKTENINNKITHSVKIRPFAIQTLKELQEKYEINIFSAGTYKYCLLIENFFKKFSINFNNILSRDNCLKTKNGVYIKNLNIIQNRDITKCIIIDDLIHSFAFNLSNGIPIKPWKYDNKDDKELLKTKKIIIKSFENDDCREYLRIKFNLNNI